MKIMLAAVLLACTTGASQLSAQTLQGTLPTDVRVRLFACAPPQRCSPFAVGVITRRTPDTLNVLTNDVRTGMSIPAGTIQRFQISRGTYHMEAALVGVALGTVAAARMACCSHNTTLSSDGLFAIGFAMFAPAGGLVGSIVGSFFEKWRDVPTKSNR